MSNIKVFTDNVEATAVAQIVEISEHPMFQDETIRIMPDVHSGKGCVIGFTSTLPKNIIPNIVGVDINCGVHAVLLGERDIDLPALDTFINNHIPHGFAVNEKRLITFNLLEQLTCYDALTDVDRMHRAIGSLGGGNHYIEISVDKSNKKWLTIHSGSRNLGKQVADYHQNIAISNNNHNNKDLCYLEGRQNDDYLNDMEICMDYATENRLAIANRIIDFLGIDISQVESFTSVHNYVSKSHIRKGAIAAYWGDPVIIPINMRDGSILGIGKGNADWNCSAPHGAGRLLSRAQAKKKLSMEDFEQTMQGIYTSSVVPSTLDEAPDAYKSIDEIVEAIKDTVFVADILKPIYNFKSH